MVPKMLLYERHIFLMTPYRGFLKCNQQNQFLVVAGYTAINFVTKNKQKKYKKAKQKKETISNNKKNFQ